MTILYKTAIRRALCDIFNISNTNKNNIDGYKKELAHEVQSFINKFNVNEKPLNIVLMLIIWLKVYPDQVDNVKSFISKFQLERKLYGGLSILFVDKNKKSRIRLNAWIQCNDYRKIKRILDSQYCEICYLIDYKYSSIFTLIKIFQELNEKDFNRLVLSDTTHWIDIYYFKSKANDSNNITMIDSLLKSNNCIKVGITFYFIIEKINHLVSRYCDNLRNKVIIIDNDSIDSIKVEIEKEYLILYFHLKDIGTTYIFDLIIYHILDINRFSIKYNLWIIDLKLLQLLFSEPLNEYLIDRWKKSICDISELYIFFRCLTIIQLNKEELSKYHKLGIEIFLELIENDCLLITNDVNNNPLYSFHKNDNVYIEFILKILPDKIKNDLSSRLCKYQKILYSSEFDKLVRFNLYNIDYRKNETVQYILDHCK